MPFRYECTECDFDHFSPGVASAHEANENHRVEPYSVDESDGYTWQGAKNE